MAEAMTELDEIVLVAKMAWALRHIGDPATLNDALKRYWAYDKHGVVDLSDYRQEVAIRLDRKAWASEQHRRALEQTKVLA
jgi:hypothetical protein